MNKKLRLKRIIILKSKILILVIGMVLITLIIFFSVNGNVQETHVNSQGFIKWVDFNITKRFLWVPLFYGLYIFRLLW